MNFTERAAWILGIGGLLYCGVVWINGSYAQARGEDYLRAASINDAASIHPGDPVGRIEIPSVGLSTIIFEDATDASLLKGVAHVRESALPGHSGNVVLAGHRDTFLRPVKHVELGDLIYLRTARAVTRYQVNSIRVLDPENTYVMRQSTASMITLITCYPFRYIGSAPKRYVIQGVILLGTDARNTNSVKTRAY